MYNVILKKIIKKTMLGNFLFKARRNVVTTKYAKKYFTRYMRYSATNVSSNDSKYLRLRIIVISHTIEKGLSHDVFKSGFGKDRIIELCSCLKEYISIESYDNWLVNYALGILKVYHEKNIDAGFDDIDYYDSEVLQLVAGSIETHGGAKEYLIQENQNLAFFSEYMKTRCSVRLFDVKGEMIEENELLDAIRIAQTSPTACNRQAIRVHAVLDKELFCSIEALQLGCRGFATTASAFIFLTCDLSLYECGEYILPFYETGLFTMNLIYSLIEKNIYSCILNPSFPNDTRNDIYKLIRIPNNEVICGMLVVYKIPPNTMIHVPSSLRRDVRDMIHFVK